MSDPWGTRDSYVEDSESYIIAMDDDEIGRIDLHYTNTAIYGTLAVVESLTEEQIRTLIGDIDESLVASADPYREDFQVTVWTGREYGNVYEKRSSGWTDAG